MEKKEQIFQTSDFSIFKYFDCNREIVNWYVTKVANSIKKQNMLEKYPIIVDKDMHVIDGQHRIEACKRLGIPIFYRIDPKAKKEDIVKLNTHSPWIIQDFVRYFCSIGNEHFLRAKRISEKFEVPISAVMDIVATGRKGVDAKRGDFVFSEEKEQEVREILKEYVKVREFIKGQGDWRWFSQCQSGFIRAFYQFFKSTGISADDFIKKMAMRPDFFVNRSTQTEKIKMFYKIYNYRQRHQLDNPYEND